MYTDWMRLYQEPGSEFNLKKERSSLSDKKSVACKDEWMKTKDGRYLKVNCMDVCEYMFHVLNKRVQGKMKLNIAFTVLVAAAVVFNYWNTYSYVVQHSVYTKVFFVSAVYMLSVFFPVLFLFCMAAMTDVYRRYEFSGMLRELITVSDVKMVDTRMYERAHRRRRKEAVQLRTCSSRELSTLNSFGMVALPRIDMSMPANYISWCMCRQVLTGAGNRFLFRTNMYIGNSSCLACWSSWLAG
jgi:hypothetical protein